MKDPIAQTILTATEQAAKVVADATETAKGVVEKATAVATDLAAKTSVENEQTTKALENALREVFGEHTKSQRFVDVTRIPLICKSIFDTSERLKEISTKLDTNYVTKEAFTPVKNIAYGIVTLILIAVVGALLTLVLK